MNRGRGSCLHIANFGPGQSLRYHTGNLYYGGSYWMRTFGAPFFYSLLSLSGLPAVLYQHRAQRLLLDLGSACLDDDAPSKGAELTFLVSFLGV